MTAILEGQDRLAAYRVPDDAQHVLRIADAGGATVHTWTLDDTIALEEARQAYASATSGGGTATFAMDTTRTTGEKIDTFDETLGQVEVIRSVQGG